MKGATGLLRGEFNLAMAFGLALNSNNMLLANWSTDAVNVFSMDSGVAAPLIRDIFTVDANASAIRPAQ